MIGHHNEIVHPEFSCSGVGTHHVNQEHCIAFRLQKSSPMLVLVVTKMCAKVERFALELELRTGTDMSRG